MTTSPIISVIIPVYNVEQYLRQCLDSVLAQTFTDFEVIIVDDGCTDGSGDICDEYAQKDNRIRVFHKANMGVSAARNDGIKVAKGKYIVFIDPDDYVEKDYLKTLYENIQQMPGHSLVSISRKNITGNQTDDVSLVEQKTETTVQDALRIMLQKESFGVVWNSIYDRDILIKNSIFFDERMQMWEDRHFNLRYIKRIDKVCLLPDVLYNYRILKHSACHEVKDWQAFYGSIIACHEEISPYLCDHQVAELEFSEVFPPLRYILYSAYSHLRKDGCSRQYKSHVYATYVKYLKESPDTPIIHNPHSRLMNSLHNAVWATHCNPLIKAFLYIAPSK